MKNMKTLKVIGKSTVLAMCLAVSSAQAGGVACVVDEVLQNSEERSITFNDQTFAIKPPEIVDKIKGGYTLSGTLERRDSSGQKHRIAYRATKEKGAIKRIEMQTDGGMWLPLSPEMTRALGDYAKASPISDKKEQEVHAAMYQAAKDGSWQKSAELIIAFMAIRHC